MSRAAWVTLATTDGYAVGALVLAHSLRAVGTRHTTHVLFTAGVSPPMREQLQRAFTRATEVSVLDSNDAENLALIGRADLGVTFSKLHCWRLTDYDKCVFLDADTLLLRNADELFERPDFAAAPDIGWPDFFNSGVMVLAPSIETYRRLVQFGVEHGTFDGGDQGLLNQFYPRWREMSAEHRLPFTYNVTSGLIYSYAAALKVHGKDIKIVHFLGKDKPWHSPSTRVHVDAHWSHWQSIYEEHVKPNLPEQLASSEPAPRSAAAAEGGAPSAPAAAATESSRGQTSPAVRSTFAISPASSRASSALSVASASSVTSSSSTPSQSIQRYENWERGAPDYAGSDAFSNVLSHIKKTLDDL